MHCSFLVTFCMNTIGTWSRISPLKRRKNVLYRIIAILNKFVVTIGVYFLTQPFLQHKQVYSLQAEERCQWSDIQNRKRVGSSYDFLTKSWWPCVSKGNWYACCVSFQNFYLKSFEPLKFKQSIVFNQGGWENDETEYEAACREALEEAGVKGKLNVCSISCLML